MKNKLISDIEELIKNLVYLREFVETKINESNEQDFMRKINTINTEIQLFKNKLKPKK